MKEAFMHRLWLLAGLVVLVMAGCGGGGSGGGSSTGTLAVSMTDATLPDFKAIYVTVDEVQVHPADANGGNNAWLTVATPGKTVNLLELVNGVRSELGISDLATGHYTLLRLVLGDEPDGGLNLLSAPHPFANYFIDDTDAVEELKVPSGLRTGIKIVRGFDINENQTTELVLDFDAMRSVVRAGSSGQWLVKPTFKVLNTETWAVVRGTASFDSTSLAGVLVSAQVYNPAAGDPRDQVVVEAATVTDENGSFALFLEPGSYNLVASRIETDQAYGPACAAIEVGSDATLNDQDFDLGQTDQVGSIGGTIDITGATEDQHATLSFRQGASCSPRVAEQIIEVASLNAADGGAYSVNLPVAGYDGVGWTAGKETVVAEDVAVADGLETALDFLFE